MKSRDDRTRFMHDVGEQILTALAVVAEAAQSALSRTPSSAPSVLLANPTNPMVGANRAERNIQAISSANRENLLRLAREPLVARVEVIWDHGKGNQIQTIYFSRASAAVLSDPISGAQLVTALAPLGQLAEHEAGELVQVEVAGHKKQGRVRARGIFRSAVRSGTWDAAVQHFEAMPWGELLEMLQHVSIRQALAFIGQAPVADEDFVGQIRQQAMKEELEKRRVRRKVVDRIALRDQPILDKFQGEIFRLPLNRQVMLFGPPGSGKTTTLIKRVAQKRTPGALTEAEENTASEHIRQSPYQQDNWAMFSPTELLKMYLGDAFNQEGVPDAGNVRTWERERHDLARNVFRILRSNNYGRFQFNADQSPLADPSSRGISKLHDEFAGFVHSTVLLRCTEALQNLTTSPDDRIKKEILGLQYRAAFKNELVLNDVLNLFDYTQELQATIKRLADETSEELRNAANDLLRSRRGVLDEIAELLPRIRAEEDDDEDLENIDGNSEITPTSANSRTEALSILLRSLRGLARATVQGRVLAGRSGRLIDLLGGSLLPEERLTEIGERVATLSDLRTLAYAPRTFVFGAPAMYARFRRQAMRDGRHFLSNDATLSFVTRRHLSADETDILLLAMLRNARLIGEYPDGRRLESPTQSDWLESIKSRYLVQVLVDEATDLSAVQLACTVEMAHPRLRSWFACGDLRQRVTSNGITDRQELEWLNQACGTQIEVREIDIGYRQSQRLRELGDALATLDTNDRINTKAARGDEEADEPPLIQEGLSGEALGVWLAERIHEVERSLEQLPSIAVFVDGDELIDPIVEAAKPHLAQRNIPIVACKEGRVVGDEREVRVFDVRHIKGLEFEAVFFIGIDSLARNAPSLFHRYFYVGVTRAATYLGVTCEGVLPKRLEAVRHHFETGAW